MKAARKISSPTVADVARMAGVGAITVSRVVNGGSYVSAEKQRMVHQAIHKLGYRPNQAARILKGSKAHMIGLIVPDLADRFFGQCASAIERYAISQGYVTLIVASRRKHEVEKSEIETMLSQNIAGLIIVPSGDSSHLKQLFDQNVPIVAVDRPVSDVSTDEVVVENLGGARLAVEHLIQHGHQRIACIGYDESCFTIRSRIHGYESAMRAAGLKPLIFTSTQTKESVFRLVERWKTARDRPTAIFSLNNVATIWSLEALQYASLQIPQDMALIGFDDFDLAPLMSPPITTVRQPAADLGEEAVKLLFARMKSGASTGSPAKTQQVVLPVKLIVRGSCGCAWGQG